MARTGLRRNHSSCQSVPACSSAGCLSRTSRTYRTLPRTVSQEALHLYHLLFLLFQTLKCILLPRHNGDHLHLIIGGHDDHPGVANRPLRYGPGPPIVIPPYHPPGHLHLEDLGLVVCPRAVSAPGHPAGIVFLDRTQLTNTSYASVSTMETNIHVILQYQNNQPQWMTLSCQLRRCKNCSLTFWTLLHYLTTLIHCRIVRRATSWYHMILPPSSSSAAPRVNNIEPLKTYGLFQNYQSFHRLSGDQDKEACTTAYHDLTNLMLSQTPEEVSLINVSFSRPKPEGPYSSFLAATDELKKKQDKIHLQWPPLKIRNKVIQRTLSLYQHGLNQVRYFQPMASSSGSEPMEQRLCSQRLSYNPQNPFHYAKTLGSTCFFSPNASTSTVHSCNGGPGLGHYEIPLLAWGLCSQVFPHFYHVSYIHGRSL